MTAFIVGARGYIGGRLLTAATHKLQTVGITSDGREGTLSMRLEAPELFDYNLVRANDTVFIAAAMSSPDQCSREKRKARAINVTGTRVVIDNVISRGGRVIFFSSDTVYGNCTDETTESAICSPIGEYAEMKYEVESIFLREPLFKSIRLSYVFSKDDKFSTYLLRCANRDEEAEVYDPLYRAVIHRDDVIDAALALAMNWTQYPQNLINVGGPRLLSRQQFAHVLRSVVADKLRYRVVEPGIEFYASRPRVINMASPILTSLLGREPRSLFDAATFEFGLGEL